MMYHLTARNVIGSRFSTDVFHEASVALVEFCPPPSALAAYSPTSVSDQHFIHVSPQSVQLLSARGQPVVSLTHVYGGPVASATVEELAYYGITHILAYGLAGALGAPSCPMGARYLVEDALAADGTTRHYTDARIVPASPALVARVDALWRQGGNDPLQFVRAATGDAIYREDQPMLDGFRAAGCHIVNLDSAHLYAVSRHNSEGAQIEVVQCGVISDVMSDDGRKSQTSLDAMLTTQGDTNLNPMHAVNEIVQFYLDVVVPNLAGRERAKP